MKTKILLLAAALTATRVLADVLAADTAVFMQPDPKSPVLVRLKSGNTIVYTGDAPAGWRRVETTGTFEGYARNRDITKALEVHPGASIYTAPDKTSTVLTIAQKDDKTEVTGLHGEFCQIKVTKTLQGFVATGAIANTPADNKPTLQAVSTPVPPVDPNTPGRQVPIAPNSAELPRLFSGTFTSARRPIVNPNPLYDYQLNDSDGHRFAYVDTRSLLLDEKIQNYAGLVVVINGTIRNTVDGKDLVIEAQSIQRK